MYIYPIKSNSFVISNLDNTGKSFIAFYDSDKNYISRTGGQNQNSILATNIPNNACYFILTQYSFANETERNNSKNSIKPQLEYGLLETEYQPAKQDKKPLLYYNPTTETWEKPVLREWDSIEKHSDGKYYYHRRSGEVVLDGSELGWRMADPSSANEDNIRVYTSIKNAKAGAMVVCDKFNVVDTINYEGVKFANNQNFHISLAKNKLSSQDVVGFKAWLQANPVTVVYQLAEGKVYECTNLDLITYANETNYIVNTGAISPKSTLKLSNSIGNVVNLLKNKISILEDLVQKLIQNK